MIGLPVGTKIWIAAGVTDLRRGFTGLSGMVQTALEEKRLNKGDLVLLASVGAGFTVGATLLRWEF